MKREFEVKLDGGNTLLVGDVEVTDASYRHEYGTIVATGLRTTNFRVITYINGDDYIVNSVMTENALEKLEAIFEDEVQYRLDVQVLE